MGEGVTDVSVGDDVFDLGQPTQAESAACDTCDRDLFTIRGAVRATLLMISRAAGRQSACSGVWPRQTLATGGLGVVRRQLLRPLDP